MKLKSLNVQAHRYQADFGRLAANPSEDFDRRAKADADVV